MEFDLDSLSKEDLWSEFVEHTKRWLNNYYRDHYIYDPERKEYV